MSGIDLAVVRRMHALDLASDEAESTPRPRPRLVNERLALVLSGGGSRGAFAAGAAEHLVREGGLSLDLVVGNSCGAILAGPAALGDWQTAREVFCSTRTEDILETTFGQRALSRVLSRLVGGYFPPIGASAEGLHRRLRRYYLSEGRLDDLLDSGTEVVVTTTSVRTGNAVAVSSEDVRAGRIPPAGFVRAIVASCCQPFFMQPGRPFSDGGATAHTHGAFFDGGLRQYLPVEEAVRRDASSVWAIMCDPEQPSEADWAHEPERASALQAFVWGFATLVENVQRYNRFQATTYGQWSRVRRELEARATRLGLDAETVAELLHFGPEFYPLSGSGAQLRLLSPEGLPGEALDFDPALMSEIHRRGVSAARAFLDAGAPEYRWASADAVW